MLLPSSIFGYKAAQASSHPASSDTGPLLVFLQFLPQKPTRTTNIQGFALSRSRCAAPIIMADYLKALLGFAKYSPAELRDFARATYMGIKDNPLYPTPPVSMEDLLAQIERVSACIAATMDGSRTAFAERNKQVEELRKMLVQNGYYVETRALDTPSFLLSGYRLAPESRTQTPSLNSAIRNIDWGENSGSFRFRFMAVEGADSYELRWAPQLPDGTPGDWKSQPFGKTKAYITLDGFTPGTLYIFQVRALIHMQFADWSDPVTKMCP